jgi:Ion channel
MTTSFKNRLPGMTRHNRSVLLLASLVLFFALAPILEGQPTGGLLLILNLYITLITATSELADKRVLGIAIPIAITSMALLLASHYYDAWPVLFANYLVLAVFLTLVSASLFAYLGRREKVTRDRILISVSLYFLLGLTWYALFNVIDLVQPGSFAEAGRPLTGIYHLGGTMLYFSLVTLTTLGYGDIAAIKPVARMVTALEAVTGVLYIAITVARLVGSQKPPVDPEK